MRILEYVRHAPDAVVHLDQPVGVENFLPRGLFRWRETITYHLEYIRIRGQGEHRHDHALDPGSKDKLIFRMLQMMQKIPVKNGLALFVKSDGRIKGLLAAVRHQAPQKGDDRRWYRVVDHEINVREFEQPGQSRFADDDRIAEYRLVTAVQDWNCKRYLFVRIDRAPDDIGGLVAIEDAADHLKLKIQMCATRT